MGYTGMGQVFTFAHGMAEYRAGENVTTVLQTHVEVMFLFMMTSHSRMDQNMNVKNNYECRLMKLCLICAFMILFAGT